MNKIVSFVNSRRARFAAIGALSLSQVPAHAALDIAAATTAVSDAQTALLAVLALIIAMGASVWALKKVAGLFGGK